MHELVVYPYLADNLPVALKPGTMPSFHTDLRGCGPGVTSFLLPTHAGRTRMAVRHAPPCFSSGTRPRNLPGGIVRYRGRFLQSAIELPMPACGGPPAQMSDSEGDCGAEQVRCACRQGKRAERGPNTPIQGVRSQGSNP